MSKKQGFKLVLIGAFLGSILSSWLAPKMIAWYFDPPVNIGINCKAATEWAMSKLQWAQFIGMLSGCVLTTVALFIANRYKKASG